MSTLTSTTTPNDVASSNRKLEFTIFPTLPPEMREKIWKMTPETRLIHWRPGGAKAPANLFVCRESRSAIEGDYVLCFVAHFRHGQYGLFLNFSLDTVYRKQPLPNLVRMQNFPCDFPNYPNKTAFSTSPALSGGPVWNVQPWVGHLKCLAIDIREAARVYHNKGGNQTIWTRVKSFRGLEELNIVINGTLEKVDTIERLVEIDEKSVADNDLQQAVHHLRLALQRHHAYGCLTGLKLTFMDVLPRRPFWDTYVALSNVGW